MRLLALATFAAGMALAAGPVRAQTYDPSYPVCMKISGDPTYFECQYATMDECRGNMKGRSAECLMNPFFGSAHKAAADPRRRAN